MPWWRFWKPETEAEKEQILMQKAAIAALESGDIPPLAKERIDLHLKKGQEFFSSDLSVREFLLTRESGIETISQVMGTAFYNVSFWGSYMGAYRATGELAKITQAQTDARRLAMARMRREAQLLGASGVIGVRLRAKPSGMGSRMTEFTAYGTAVRIPGYPTDGEPFTSDLNGQDFWQLYKAGYKPKGLVMGLCSYYIWTNWKAQWQLYGLFGVGLKNQEIESYANGFYESRNRAINRLTQELYDLRADGCVGMSVHHYIEKIEHGSEDNKQIDLLINFSALGTAVDTGPPLQPTQRSLVIDLRKGERSNVLVQF